MSRFRYTAANRNGEIVKGTIEAASVENARGLLTHKRLRPIKIGRDWLHMELTSGRVKRSDIVAFTRQMAVMAGAGLPLNKALEIMLRQMGSQGLGKIVEQLVVDVQGGEALSTALRRHPSAFSPLYANMVLAGEKSGSLDITLSRLADYIERNHKVLKTVRGALTYPAFVFVFAIVALVFMYIKVIPKFEDMFRELGNDLPMFTRFHLWASVQLRSHPWGALGTAMLVGFGAYYAIVNPVTRKMLDRWGLKIPVIGSIIQKGAVARFARTLSTLLQSGVPIIEALPLTADTAGNIVVEEAIRGAWKRITEGESIAEPLAESGVFPPMVCSMIAVGEGTGKLNEMLDRIADAYEEDVAQSVDAATQLLNPIFILLMAGLVGSIVASIYLPIAQSMQHFAQ